MKTILIPVTTNFFSRNFLRTDAYGQLRASGAYIVLLVPPRRLAYYRSEFSASHTRIEAMPDVRTWIEDVFLFVETASIHSRTEEMLQFTELYRRGARRAVLVRYAVFVVRRACWVLGRFSWWRMLVRRAYFLIPHSAAVAVLTHYRPDLVFAPAMIGGDYPFLKEAKRQGIKTAGMVLSWDNLFSKTLLRVHPDRLLVHTEYLKDQAVNLGDFPARGIEITGVPQYDRYFQRKSTVSRERFITALGGDPAKKLILYAFSGKSGIGIEFEVVKILHEIIKGGELGEDVEVLLRPYPRYDFPEEKLERMRRDYGFLAAPAVAHIGDGKDDWEFDGASADFLHATLAHADVVFTMYSTFFIEAAIFDKPILAVAFDGLKKRDYWNSAARFFEWEHLARLMRFKAMDVITDREEMARAIRTALKNPEAHAGGRSEIVRDQCGYTDGRAGERVAASLTRMLN
ncbi:MAG: hypothetical protein A3J58_02625 [Candidatus Sungbacteria bacterium RIFCSPHIGHO2_02_FULL_52_23]|uniref:Glycosyltransferase subfamily 4-like N-terminal domain-containing protein n=1 Tax=Candidatus Sungbacteria bacterium RIFCSPHIGHO2_02_FULL_52_23 TaxID=1802274 RepID=A0A1G2KTQ4_9BACT|nr:MAG: hypothetical protein A3J58_02625 [Candidatus Sungbacteria bacterium RIFCSPHIGHO2_02_FULL_52_23]